MERGREGRNGEGRNGEGRRGAEGVRKGRKGVERGIGARPLSRADDPRHEGRGNHRRHIKTPSHHPLHSRDWCPLRVYSLSPSAIGAGC
eukprot:6593622-Pyramimonas_sp.AAC.1